MKKRLSICFAALLTSVSLLSGCVINLPSEKNNSENEKLQKQIEALTAELSELRSMLTLEPGALDGEGTEISDEEAAELSGLFTMEDMDMLSSPSGSVITPRDWNKYTSPSAKKGLSYNEAAFYDRLDKVCRDYLNGSLRNDVLSRGNTLLKGVRYSDLLSSDKAQKVFNWFRVSNPQYFFINNSWSYSNSEIFIHIGDYVTSLSDPARSTNELFDKLDSWIEECSDNETTTWEKVLAANKKICESVIYSPAVKAGNMQASNGKNQSMFSVLMSEDTVCAGYALTFSAMTNAMGIDSLYVSSDDHAWNATQFDDGCYYFVDVCWNDTENGYEEDFIGVGTDYAAYRDEGSSSHVYETDIANWAPAVPKGDYRGTDNTLLNAPSLRVTGSGSRAAKIEWNAVDNAKSYEFSITNGEKIIYNGTTTRTNLYTAFPNGIKSAEAKVRAIGAKNGYETKSEWSEITVSPSKPADKPATPTNVKTELREKNQFWITWDDTDESIQTVYLRFKDGNFTTAIYDSIFDNGNLYYSNWEEQDLYFCLINAKQSGGKEVFSDPVYFSYSSADGWLIPTLTVTPIERVISAPTGLKASADRNFVTCPWTTASGVDGYEFHVSFDADFSKIWGSAIFKSDYNQATFTAPDGKNMAYVRIRSFKGNGSSKVYSDWVTASCKLEQTVTPAKPAKPAAPTGFKGEATTKDKSTFTWNAVPGASGYNIALFRDAAHKDFWADYSVTETSMWLSPLVDGTTYHMGIRAVKSENGVNVYSDYVYIEYTHKYKAPTADAGQVVKTYSSGSVYVGQMKNGKREGQGTMTFASGDVYIGEWKNDLKNGYGIYTWSDGDVYEGEYKNDKRNGHGKYTWPDGDVYEGEYKDGKRTGHGKYTWSNGNVYEGEYKDDKKNGHGKMIWASGNVYEGEYKDDKINGNGKLTFYNGNVYEGEFKDGKTDGNGKVTFANGDVYEGDFKDNKMDGQGKGIWSDGTVYEGGYSNNKLSGHGKKTWSDGSVYEGEFKDNKMEGHGRLILADGSVYDGDFKDDKYWGYGKYSWADGSSYEGDFKNNMMDGYGKYTWPDGSSYEGGWKNSVRHGKGTLTGTDGTTAAQVWNEGNQVS